MADEDLNPKMRYNPLWYQGWEFDDATIDLSNIQGDLDMKGHGIINLKNPTNPSDAASKDYVDKAVAGGGRPLVASQVASTGTNQIQAQTVQAAIDEISNEAAFVDASNTFQEVNVFSKAPKLSVGVQPTDPQDLANLGKVNELIAAIKAVGVAVDQTTPLVNLTAANVQEALQQADDLFSEISELIVENTSLVGTYNATTNLVVEAFGGAPAGAIVAGQALPTPVDENKGMYVMVVVGGTGTAPAPTVAVQPGDILISNGTHWNKIATALPITTLAASQVTFDNTTTQIAGADTVQKAIDGVNTKFDTALANINATGVAFTPAQGIAATNVSDALKELKTNADNLGNTYVTKTGGELTGDLNANNQGIVTLRDPINDKDAAHKKYVDTLRSEVVTKTGGQLTGNLDAQDHKIVNVALPTDNKDAANKQYVDTKTRDYVLKDGGELVSALNARNQKINNLGDGVANGDAINKGQLDAAIASLSSQLTGKLTFIGTYNAQNNQIVTLTSAAGAHPEYVVGQALPADKTSFTNHFFIVTVAGTGTAPAPTVALNIGDLIYSSGTGWAALPLGTSRMASNVGITAIQQLPGVNNVQVALETLAANPGGGGGGTAATITFNPAGNLQSTNVQAALEELDTQKAADNQVVKLTGNQDVAGTKNFTGRTVFSSRPVSVSFVAAQDQASYMEWLIQPNGGRYTYVGYGDSAAGRRGTFQFWNDSNDNPKFEFNRVIRYFNEINLTDNKDLVYKKYAENNFVRSGDFNQEVNGTKIFLKPIQLRLSAMDSKFAFLDFETNNKVAPQANLIHSEVSGYAHIGGSLPRVLGFAYEQSGNVPVRSAHFVLKYKNPNVHYLWFRLSHQPNFGRVECSITGNKLIFVSNDAGSSAPTATNTGVILEGVANATADSHAVNRGFANSNYVRTSGNVNQNIDGIKTFGSQLRGGFGAGYLRFTPEDNSTKTLYFSDTSVGANNKFNLDLERKSALKNLIDPTNDYDAVHKKYVDDAVAQGGGTSPTTLEKRENVDIAPSIASFAGKGTFTFSSRLLRDTATKDVISAMFGMKLTLTAPWNPGNAAVPVELQGCHVNGEEYFKGLPVPIDSTLQGGSFKTVAQIQLIRVVPTGGVNLPQADTPLQIGRIVCAVDGGNSKLYAVFNHNADIAVPTGTGAFFIMRYEGLATMVI